MLITKKRTYSDARGVSFSWIVIDDTTALCCRAYNSASVSKNTVTFNGAFLLSLLSRYVIKYHTFILFCVSVKNNREKVEYNYE